MTVVQSSKVLNNNQNKTGKQNEQHYTTNNSDNEKLNNKNIDNGISNLLVHEHKKTSKFQMEIMFLICVAGIYVFYLLYGVYQEKLNIIQYNGEKIGQFTAFLLGLQCLVNYLSALVVKVATKEKKDNTPISEYRNTALLIVISTFLSNTSIRYISYPTQVLAKSCKPIPVLVMGVLCFKRRYSAMKYFIVLVISMGVAMFMWPSGKKHSTTSVEFDSNVIFGNLLLLGSLLLDGVIGPSQDQYVRVYNPSSNSMMLYTNLWNTFFMFAISAIKGEIVPAIQYIIKYPEIIGPIFIFCITSALGQHFIFLTTKNFSALTCTTVTTTRKFFSILISIFWFGHSLSALQWSSIALVFLGLSLDVVQSYFMKPSKSKVQ
ncbi:Galactose transporter [Heterostelium album PN500]|uniref:Galactose transporter n=1 Tax=Heterostelium pallidum (strain ATCC 26659 / Pp 5 / PN500) TaxID=670386 RepID=D3B1Z1_HETP5|nr:Galactose transporter [Heterostelium album PN500]EFA85315.1 Galactose transporter [Heterostelium album PN500]|eukprot:XP_020437424.1 Galactose transporter [Heterostelium album PN500]